MKQIENTIIGIYNKISSNFKIAALSSFLFGILIHMMVWVNHLPAYSGLVNLWTSGEGHAVEGRWFTALLVELFSRVTIPYFLGIFSLALWSLSYALIVNISKIMNKGIIILGAGVFISFPTIAAMNHFMFMSHCFAASVLLAVLAAYLLFKQSNMSFCGGILCAVLSLATYQASISYLMVIIFISVATDLIDGEKIKGICKKIGKYFFFMVCSFGVYYLTFKTYLNINEIVSYRDFEITFDSLLLGMIKCYGGTYWFLKWGSFFSLMIGKIVVFVTVITILSVLFLMIQFNWKHYTKKCIRILMLFGLVLLFPIISNYAFLISPMEDRTYRQFGSYALFILLPVFLLDRYGDLLLESKLKTQRAYTLLLQGITVILMLVSILFFSITDNIAYMKSYLTYEKEYSLAIRIVDRIENTNGYVNGMPVIVVYREPYDNLYGGLRELQLDQCIPGMEQHGNGYLVDGTALRYFVNEFLQTNINFQWEAVDENIFDDMKKWPNRKSVLIKDGKMYIWLT